MDHKRLLITKITSGWVVLYLLLLLLLLLSTTAVAESCREVWSENGKKMPCVLSVLKKVTPLGDNYVLVDHKVYYFVERADREDTCHGLGCLSRGGGGVWTHHDYLIKEYLLLNPQPQSVTAFKILSKTIPVATDGNVLFYKNNIVQGYAVKDGLSQVVPVFLAGKRQDVLKVGNSIFQIGYKNVTLLKDITDPESAEVLESYYYGSDFIKDKFAVYYQGKQIANANPKTFHFINRSLMSDDKSSWKIDFSDLELLEKNPLIALDANYTKTINHVYSRTRLIKGADPASFELVTKCDAVAKSDNPKCDLQRDHVCTLKIFPNLNCGEVNYQPSYSNIPEISKDKNNVYVRDEVLDRADPTSFQVLYLLNGYLITIDKNFIYGQDLGAVDSLSIKASSHNVYGPIYLNGDKSKVFFVTPDKMWDMEIRFRSYSDNATCIEKLYPKKKLGLILPLEGANKKGYKWAFEDDYFQYFYTKIDGAAIDKITEDYMLDKTSLIKYKFDYSCEPITLEKAS